MYIIILHVHHPSEYFFLFISCCLFVFVFLYYLKSAGQLVLHGFIRKTLQFSGFLQLMILPLFEPRSEKTGLRSFRPGPTQTGLCSHRRWLEACNFVFKK